MKNKLIKLLVVGSANLDIIRLIEDINDFELTYDFLGFLEKDTKLFGKKLLGYDVLGADDLLLTKYKDCAVVNNIYGNSEIHVKVTKNLKEKFNVTKFPSLIHPSVNTKYVKIGEGNIIHENVVLGVGVEVGNFNIFYQNASIGHDTIIGDNNLFANCNIGAKVKIKDRVICSNGATVTTYANICSDVFIGVGSVVVRSIKKAKKVFGNPAKKY